MVQQKSVLERMHFFIVSEWKFGRYAFYSVVANEETFSADVFRRGTSFVFSHICTMVLQLPRSGR